MPGLQEGITMPIITITVLSISDDFTSERQNRHWSLVVLTVCVGQCERRVLSPSGGTVMRVKLRAPALGHSQVVDRGNLSHCAHRPGECWVG